MTLPVSTPQSEQSAFRPKKTPATPITAHPNQYALGFLALYASQTMTNIAAVVPVMNRATDSENTVESSDVM